jgi:hypothetical protein
MSSAANMDARLALVLVVDGDLGEEHVYEGYVT